MDYISDYHIKTSFFYKENNISDTTLIDKEWKHTYSGMYLQYYRERVDFTKSFLQYYLSDNFPRETTRGSYYDKTKFKFVAKVTILLYPKAPYNTDVISMTRTFDCETKRISTPSSGGAQWGSYN